MPLARVQPGRPVLARLPVRVLPGTAAQPVLAVRGVTVADPVVVVTSDFHTLRAQAIARRQGWQQVQAVGAPTPLYLRYNAWLREYFALASSRVLGEM